MARKRRADKPSSVAADIYKQAEIDGPNGKIFVGIPRERVYIPAFVDNRDALLANLQRSERGIGYYQAESHRVDRNRDGIVNHFMNLPSKPEWLLMIDTDMEHPSEAAVRLASYGKPIISALYFHRGRKHDPFVFRRGPNGTDQYGRTQMKWEPMRDEVFDFLEQHNIPMQDGSFILDNTYTDPLIKCDAVATGCIMIHRSVFEAMKAPWWEYPAGGYSEDLYFCHRVGEELGLDIYCDISTICGHFHWTPMGQAQFRQVYRNFGLNATTYSKEKASSWLAEYFQMEPDKAHEMLLNGNAHMVGDYWLSRKPETSEEIEAFYKDAYTGKLYAIELLHWNATDVFETMRTGLIPFRNRNILEIGGGIGTISMQLALQQNSVTMVEPNDTLRGFAKMRWDNLQKDLWGKRGIIDFVPELSDSMDYREKYDNVVAIDVLEHLDYSTLVSVINKIWISLKPSGTFAFHANFGQQDLYPMHFDHSEVFEKVLNSNGFILETPVRARKVNRDD